MKIKKYLIFCSLLIMIVCSCFIVNGASGEVYPGGYSGSRFYTSSDNLSLEYIDIGDRTIAWYNESLLNFPYVSSFDALTGSYYIGADNLEFSYDIADLRNDLTCVSSSSSIQFMRLDFGHSFLPIDNDNATNIRLSLSDLTSGSYRFTYRFYISGLDLQYVNDEWIEVPFNYSDTFTITFEPGVTEFTFNYLSLYSEELYQYASNSILNITYMTVGITNEDNYQGSIDRQYIYYRKLNEELTTSNDWLGNITLDISEFAVSLLKGVNNFLQFEIYPNFSLLNLLYLIIGIPLLIAILRLFLGG